MKSFRTPNALGAHKKYCERAIAVSRKPFQNESDEKSCIFLSENCSPPSVSRNASEKDVRTRAPSRLTPTVASEKLDGRKENRGAAVRKRFDSRYKVEFVDPVNE